MNSPVYSYRDRQMQDLAEHRKGCSIVFLSFVAIAIGIFLYSLSEGHPVYGLCVAAFILLVGAIILGFSYKEYHRKLKEMKK